MPSSQRHNTNVTTTGGLRGIIAGKRNNIKESVLLYR
jgi:hypothetical protein